jgi:hypothetical protein
MYISGISHPCISDGEPGQALCTRNPGQLGNTIRIWLWIKWEGEERTGRGVPAVTGLEACCDVTLSKPYCTVVFP